ncbi:MAG: hypothetical protein JWO77_1169 [Ilumatobacteraceae bacterium]|nr:hypothetical protein [Ilumatobacteraceae bacterium]
MPAQVVDVIKALASATELEQLSWRKTDDPGAFILARSQGAVTVWDTGKRDPNNNDWVLVGLRFLDNDGETVFEYIEAETNTDLDRPLQNLYKAVLTTTSEIGQTMSAWLEDLTDLF